MLGIILALSLLVSDDMVVTTGMLNVNQVFSLLQRNGATPQEAATLAGISVWEAGGGNPNAINPQALNPVAPDYSIGLFQYNFRYPGGFNASNPMASTRGGYSAQELMDSIDAQAQSALALLRGSGHNYATQWSTYLPHLQSIQGFVSQLLNGGGGTTDVPSPAPIQANPPVQGSTQGSTTTTSGTEPSASLSDAPTGLNLGFTGSVQHIGFQFILVLLAIALMLGGIYLLGSKR